MFIKLKTKVTKDEEDFKKNLHRQYQVNNNINERARQDQSQPEGKNQRTTRRLLFKHLLYLGTSLLKKEGDSYRRRIWKRRRLTRLWRFGRLGRLTKAGGMVQKDQVIQGCWFQLESWREKGQIFEAQWVKTVQTLQLTRCPEMSQMGQIAAMGQRTGFKDEPVVRTTRWVRKPR